MLTRTLGYCAFATFCVAILQACGGGSSSGGSGDSGGSGQPSQYSVGGMVSGLMGSGLQLSAGFGDPLSISANGAFTFPTQLASGAGYTVTVVAQPTNPAQTCVVSNGSGTVGAANITNVSTTCSTPGITLDSAASVTILGNAVGERLLQLGSFLGERLAYLSDHLAATTTEACSDPYHDYSGGSAAYMYSDNDASGSISAGDVVTVTSTDCFSQSMADLVTGTITVTLSSPPAAPKGSMAFAASAQVDAMQLTGLQLSGTLSFSYIAAEVLQDVRAVVGTSAMHFDYQQNGGFFPTDTVLVSNATLAKTIDYTLPQYSVAIAADFQSQRLNGAFSVTTPQNLTGRIGTYPGSGMEVFRGGASVLQYTAQNADDNAAVLASLDQDGTGSFVDLGGSLFWEQGINGFAWWEPRGASVVSINSRPAYSTNTLKLWQPILMFTEPRQVDPINQILSTGINVSTPIKLFFNGPVNAAAAALQFTAATYGIPDQVSVPAVLAIAGPVITVTAQSQLQHGEPYALETLSSLTSPWAPALPGVSLSQQLMTLNNLQASASPSPGVAAPGQIVTLLSTGSVSTNSTITAWSWKQAGGPTVAITGANGATASFVVPPTSQSGDEFIFTVTVTDANGETDSLPVSVFALADLTQPFLYYHAQQLPDRGETAEVATFKSAVNGTVLTTLDNSLHIFRYIYNGASNSFEELQFQPGNSAIAPGVYTSTNTTGGLPFSLWSYSQCSGATAWQFTIYESQAAVDGTASKFSGDFAISCPSGVQPTITGSVRVNSTVPLP